MEELSGDLRTKLERKYGKRITQDEKDRSEKRISIQGDKSDSKPSECLEVRPECLSCPHYSCTDQIGVCPPVHWCCFKEWDRGQKRRIIHCRNLEFVRSCRLGRWN